MLVIALQHASVLWVVHMILEALIILVVNLVVEVRVQVSVLVNVHQHVLELAP